MLLEDHPLANTIWNVATGKQIDRSSLLSAIEDKSVVMIGEKHDNPLHHENQALLVRHLREAGAKGRLVMEMAEQAHQANLDNASLEGLDQLGADIAWEARGWPAWSQYRPIVAEALKAGMELKAGNPDRATLMQLGKNQTLDADHLVDLRWDRDYTAPQLDSLLDELVDAHCGMMDRDAVKPLVGMQKLKDAFMARALRGKRKADDVAILIAGNGHTRKDRGVRMFLDKTETVASVALIEVVRDRTDATDYPAFDPKLYDYVWFTPRVDEVDPCETFRAQLEAMKSKMKMHTKQADDKP